MRTVSTITFLRNEIRRTADRHLLPRLPPLMNSAQVISAATLIPPLYSIFTMTLFWGDDNNARNLETEILLLLFILTTIIPTSNLMTLKEDLLWSSRSLEKLSTFYFWNSIAIKLWTKLSNKVTCKRAYIGLSLSLPPPPLTHESRWRRPKELGGLTPTVRWKANG